MVSRSGRSLLRIHLNATCGREHNEIQQAIRVEVSGYDSQVFHIVGKLHHRLRLEGTISVAQQNGKHPVADAILEVPFNEIRLAIRVEIARCERPQTIVAPSAVVDGFLNVPSPFPSTIPIWPYASEQ